MATLKHAVNGGIVECDEETAKVLIAGGTWVKYTAPAHKRAAKSHTEVPVESEK